MKKILALIAFGCAVNINAQEYPTVKKDSVEYLDEVILKPSVILGNKYVAKNRTGSAFYLSAKELKKFGFTDVNRALKNIPGVSLYEEDGFGLRPNISLRGTSPERSAKISLMEDGVLIAPAPYSASAAYYFPSIARMQGIEVLKGSSQVQYGPFTTGGAINFISTEVPDMFQGEVKASYGSFNTRQIYGAIGDTKGKLGYVVEYLNVGSNGFKDLPSGTNTGFTKNDVLAKLRFETDNTEKANHILEGKFQYSDEDSNETYVGLSEADFATNPFGRYAGSEVDNMNADHMQLMLTHTLAISNNMKISTTGYHNTFNRNWYKLNDVVVNGEKVGIAAVLADTNAYPNQFGVLNGTIDSDADALLVKANNRAYTSQGIQTKFDYHWNGENTFHDLEIGARYHYDEEDRFQWKDGYSITNGQMALTFDAPGGSDANRISSSRAFASYALYKLKYKQLTLTPGIRYENISLKRDNFGTSDPTRTGDNLSSRENQVAVFIPGMGFNYNFSSSISMFGGIHKGFSPPSNAPDEKAEKSINYELGSRFKTGAISGEITGFYNDYSNLLGSDLAATGGTGSLEQFNAGEVTVNGIELLVNFNPFYNKVSAFKLPITFGYTLTQTEFENSFGSTDDLWGAVTRGDEMPYIPKHQWTSTISLEHKKFEININGRFMGEFRTMAGTGNIPANELVASNFILDFGGKYNLTPNLQLTANMINMLNNTYAVARVPAGLRPGHPFGIYSGLQFRF